jgi:hypothetical protein
MPVTQAECMKAFGYGSLSEVPADQVTYPAGPQCLELCQIRASKEPPSLKSYIVLADTVDNDNYPLQRFAAAIRLADYPDYAAFCQYVKKFSDGERIRLVKRAEKSGYFVEPCALEMFPLDRLEIHQSKETRQDRPLHGLLTYSLEQLGGLPKGYTQPRIPQCENYWVNFFGVFLSEPGHKQGEVTVDKRLIAYINLNRMGDIACYGTIIGHGAHLANGVMDLCHHYIVRTVLDERPAWAANLKYIWYAGMEDGTPGLFQWKRRSGFKPYRIYARERVAECARIAAAE